MVSTYGQVQPEVPLNYYGSPSQGVIAGQVAYGHIYSGSLGGIIYCYDD